MQPHGLLLSLIEHWETGLVNDWVRWAAVHGVARSRARLRDFSFTFHFHALEKEMAIHSSVLAWRIPGTVEPGGLPSMGSHRVRHDWSDLAAAAAAAAAAEHSSWSYGIFFRKKTKTETLTCPNLCEKFYHSSALSMSLRLFRWLTEMLTFHSSVLCRWIELH